MGYKFSMSCRNTKTSTNSNGKTVAPSSAAANALNPSIVPFSFRLPKPGTVDPYFGGTRTFWNQCILPTSSNGHQPLVKSIVRRQLGAKRAMRFIVYASARAYFEKLASEQYDSDVTKTDA